MQGASFDEVCEMTTIFEGTIIRAVRRLEELLVQLCSAAKVGCCATRRRLRCPLQVVFANGRVQCDRQPCFSLLPCCACWPDAC